MPAPTLTATLPAHEDNVKSSVPLLAGERAWLGFGQALVDLHVECEAGASREGATGAERDLSGFAARGVALAVAAWNDATAAGRCGSRSWVVFARLVNGEMADGYRAEVGDGLVASMLAMESHLAAYRAVYGA